MRTYSPSRGKRLTANPFALQRSSPGITIRTALRERVRPLESFGQFRAPPCYLDRSPNYDAGNMFQGRYFTHSAKAECHGSVPGHIHRKFRHLLELWRYTLDEKAYCLAN
jgi:hypothetical protein